MRKYWLFKSEPDVYSIHDLASEKGRRTSWEGVRNYQVRNMLRDEISRGDGVLYYHSRINPMAIVGTAKVARSGYPDHFAFDVDHRYYDARSTPETPVWYMVDIRLSQVFDVPVTRDMLRADPETAAMQVLKRGSRLSIQPVTESEWEAVHRLAGCQPK